VIGGGRVTLVDRTETEARLELGLDAMGVGVSDWDLVSGRMVWSVQQERLFGLAPGAFDGAPETFQSMVRADDRARLNAEIEAALSLGREGVSSRYRVRRPDGVERWLEASSRFVLGPDGALVRIVAAHLDVTDRVEDEARRQRLTGELAHRLKNTLAMVQAIARQSFKSLEGSSRAIEAFEQRLHSLASAHDVLTETQWEPSSLGRIVNRATAPHDPGGGRLRAEGPEVEVPPRVAVAIGLALQELATNALKYGALSNEVGRVSLSWTVEGRRLRLVWGEAGGPVVAPPERRGVGRRLLEQGLAGDLGGLVSLAFPAEGVVCVIDARIADQAMRSSG
jgi:PAS domain S-box-containing protein